MSAILSKRKQSSCQPHKKAKYGDIRSDASGEKNRMQNQSTVVVSLARSF